MRSTGAARAILAGLGLVVATGGGLFFVIMLIYAIAGNDGRTDLAILAGLLVFFGGVTAAGLFLTWTMLRSRPRQQGAASGVGRPGAARQGGPAAPPPPPRTDAEREGRVLRFAESEHGRVTIPEVATGCNMSVADSKETLDRLAAMRVAEKRITQYGGLVYVFPGFMTDEEKAQATDF